MVIAAEGVNRTKSGRGFHVVPSGEYNTVKNINWSSEFNI